MRKISLVLLTQRQREVCSLLVIGKNNKEIGYLLGISPRTAEDHRAVLFKAFDVRNAVELLRAVSDINAGPMEMIAAEIIKGRQEEIRP